MFRAPICNTSAYSTHAGIWSIDMTSVTIASPVSSRASARIFKPSSPIPWNAYGEVRGLNAPPRRPIAPASFTACAISSNLPRSSTLHGPAITPTFVPPIVANNGHHCSLGPDDDVIFQSHFPHQVDDMLDLLGRRAGFHDKDHGRPP